MKPALMLALACLAAACQPHGTLPATDAGSAPACARVPTYNEEPCCPEDVGAAKCFGTQAWSCEPAIPGTATPEWFLNGASPVSASCEPLP